MRLQDPMQVWDWNKAPDTLRALSPHGGDEDWIAEVPDYMENGAALAQLLSRSDNVSEHDHPYKPGWKVYIAAHA